LRIIALVKNCWRNIYYNLALESILYITKKEKKNYQFLIDQKTKPNQSKSLGFCAMNVKALM
jgi:hypothetical protein